MTIFYIQDGYAKFFLHLVICSPLADQALHKLIKPSGSHLCLRDEKLIAVLTDLA